MCVCVCVCVCMRVVALTRQIEINGLVQLGETVLEKMRREDIIEDFMLHSVHDTKS